MKMKKANTISVRCVKKGEVHGVSFQMENRKDELATEEAQRRLEATKKHDITEYNFEVIRTLQLSKAKSNGIHKGK